MTATMMSTDKNVNLQLLKAEYLRPASEISSGKQFDRHDGGMKGKLSIQQHLL